MGEPLATLRRATERDHLDIIRLIDQAAEWLRTKNTDQWAQPWPSEEDRSHRIRRDLQAGKTWIAAGGGTPIATVTADDEDNPVWPKEARRDPSVYVCRLVVSRAYTGRGLGAGLLDWVGLSARARYGALWVRADVWTTNHALHAYYERQGFERCEFSAEVDGYPAAALFQKATAQIEPPRQRLFQLDR